jgi:hypothetical protein
MSDGPADFQAPLISSAFPLGKKKPLHSPGGERDSKANDDPQKRCSLSRGLFNEPL